MGDEDWRLRFAKKRYTRLLEILLRRMGEKALGEVLKELGSYCAGLDDERIVKHRGDFEGYCAYIKQSASGDTITKENGVITMTSGERSACFCPLIGDTPGVPWAACSCSLGWQEHTWQTLLQKPVRVELKESVVRGGKACTFVIKVEEK